MSCESCLLKRCCCCGSLRTGTLIAGAGAIVGVKCVICCFFYTKKLCYMLDSGNIHNYHHCLDDVWPDQRANQNDRFGFLFA